MTDNTENPQKKVHLIKQPKPLQSEAVQPRAKSEDEPQIERKKVVVVKKRLVLKKAPAKVVARHEGEPAELQQESVAPVQAQQQPEMEKPSAAYWSKRLSSSLSRRMSRAWRMMGCPTSRDTDVAG